MTNLSADNALLKRSLFGPRRERFTDPAQILLFAFTHLWIWSLSGKVSGWLIQGVTFYALLHLFLFQSPIGFHLLEGINRGVIWVGRWIAGGTILGDGGVALGAARNDAYDSRWTASGSFPC